MLQVRFIRVAEVSPEVEEEWQALAVRAMEPNPSFEPEILVPASRNIGYCADLTIAVVHDGPTIRGVLPIRYVDRLESAPDLQVACTFDPRWPPGQFSCVPLIDPACPDDALDALLAAFATANGTRGPGVVRFAQLPVDGPIASALLRVCDRREHNLTIGEPWERGLVTRSRWEASVNPKHRRAFHRLQRQLAEHTGGQVSIADRTGDTRAIDDFIRMEASGWKGRHGMPVDRDPGTEAHFRESHRRHDSAGRSLVLSLETARGTVAMQYYIRSGTGIFTSRIAYDEEFARYSPGGMLLTLSIPYLGYHTDAEWLDSATQPGNQFFLNLMPERKRFAEVTVQVGGATGG